MFALSPIRKSVPSLINRNSRFANDTALLWSAVYRVPHLVGWNFARTLMRPVAPTSSMRKPVPRPKSVNYTSKNRKRQKVSISSPKKN